MRSYLYVDPRLFHLPYPRFPVFSIYSLSTAYVQSSRHDLVVGASMRRSPFVGFLYIAYAACLICLSLPSLSMCPSHCSRRARIHITTSNVLSAVASSRIVLPVIVLTILEFAPLSAAATAFVIFHASDPYVRILQTHALYRRILRFMCRSLSLHRCLSIA